MRVSLYIEPAAGGLGGAEYLLAVLAGELSAAHDVTIFHHRAALSVRELAAFSAVPLDGVRLQLTERPPVPWHGDERHPLTRIPAAGRWLSQVSQGADVFLAITHGVPPFCHAGAGVLLSLFPLSHVRRQWPWTDDSGRRPPRRVVQGWYYDWEWRRRFSGYPVKLAISSFAAQWTRLRWAIAPRILHPPVDVTFPAQPKVPRIVSVGRFATEGVRKHQRELVGAFRQILPDAEGWQYASAGSCGPSSGEELFYRSVVESANGLPVSVCRNLDREALKRLLSASRIFWHAAGLGVPPDRPEEMEHFGIATIEAMAAGCVPVVTRQGSHPEIVTHGVDGYLFDSLDELQELTLHLVRDRMRLEEMSTAARARAAQFGRGRFLEGFRSAVRHAGISV
jgi:glycosyltransferase involved in cell wall biosynthesis